jgi:hypothetical protein
MQAEVASLQKQLQQAKTAKPASGAAASAPAMRARSDVTSQASTELTGEESSGSILDYKCGKESASHGQPGAYSVQLLPYALCSGHTMAAAAFQTMICDDSKFLLDRSCQRGGALTSASRARKHAIQTHRHVASEGLQG